MDTDLPPTKLILVTALVAEAVMPDGTVQGQSTMMPPDTPEEALSSIEDMLMESLRHTFPTAAEYCSTGWKRTMTRVAASSDAED